MSELPNRLSARVVEDAPLIVVGLGQAVFLVWLGLMLGRLGGARRARRGQVADGGHDPRRVSGVAGWGQALTACRNGGVHVDG